MPLVGGGLGKGKGNGYGGKGKSNRILFNAPPVLPPSTLPNSLGCSSSSNGSAAAAMSVGSSLSSSSSSPRRAKYLPPPFVPRPLSPSASSSSSRSRSRSSRSSQHVNGDLNGVVPMSDDADTVVVAANPEEQSTASSTSSAGAEARAALASIGMVRSRETAHGLDLRTAVFVRDDMIDTNNADPVPTATALTVKCFLDAKGTGRDVFGSSHSADVPVCMRIIAQRGTKKFFRGSRVEFIFQGHELTK